MKRKKKKHFYQSLKVTITREFFFFLVKKSKFYMKNLYSCFIKTLLTFNLHRPGLRQLPKSLKLLFICNMRRENINKNLLNKQK